MKKTQKEVNCKFSTLTSLSAACYELLYQEFSRLCEEKVKYYTTKNKLRKKPKYQEPINSSLYGSKAKFDFIMLYFKHHPIQEFIGFFYEMTQEKVSEWISWISPILEKALGGLNVLAQQSNIYVHQNRQEAYIAGDVTEVPVGRKTDYSAQKEDYSGKHKCHTSKYFALCSPSKFIHYMSEIYTGSTHDYTIFQDQQIDTNGVPLLLDLGFLGASNKENTILLPFKKPKNKELSAIEKELNLLISRARVVIENAFCGVKRLAIARNKMRLKGAFKRRMIYRICVAIHNLRIKTKCNDKTTYGLSLYHVKIT